MSVELNNVKNLKIVPDNYKSGTFCRIEEILENSVKLNLDKVSEEEFSDYCAGANIEIFGLNSRGIIYFTSEILDSCKNCVSIKYPDTIKEIQRRKYSRVPFYGKLSVVSKNDIKVKEEDISAGGLRFFSDTPFMVGNEYNIKVELSNGLIVNCSMQPIRVEEIEDDCELIYSISAKFKKIRSIDRIALMQYSLRFISEMENKV